MVAWLYRWLLKTFTSEGDVILDAFAGCGGLGRECEELHRHYLGIENDLELGHACLMDFVRLWSLHSLWYLGQDVVNFWCTSVFKLVGFFWHWYLGPDVMNFWHKNKWFSYGLSMIDFANDWSWFILWLVLQVICTWLVLQVTCTRLVLQVICIWSVIYVIECLVFVLCIVRWFANAYFKLKKCHLHCFYGFLSGVWLVKFSYRSLLDWSWFLTDDSLYVLLCKSPLCGLYVLHLYVLYGLGRIWSWHNRGFHCA